MTNEDNNLIEDNLSEQSNTEDGPKRCTNASMSMIARQAKLSEYEDATWLNSVKASRLSF